ncbi:tetratricopeptide repeat protein [Candidatus Uabimicrobium sp. HlEnr_7]|uniref:tetratricopeptide repeat protein n=1 Tax=Candidatus Uabimicrobium helgolandensis TaxID=3095367 RepID=UPI0035564584
MIKRYLILLSALVYFVVAQDYNTQYQYAYKLYRQKKFVEANEIFRTILLSLHKQQNMRYKTLFFRGKCFFYRKLYRSAISQFNAAMTFGKDDVDIFYNRGKCYFFLENYDLAIDEFTKVITLFPNSVWALYYRANSYFLANKQALAQSDYERLLELSPHFYQGWIGLAKISYSKGKLRLAVEQLTKSFPAENNETHYYLGIIALHNNKTVDASFSFKKAIKYNEQDQKSWYELAKIYLKEQKYTKALQGFMRAENSINSKGLLLQKGICLYYLNRYQEAMTTFKQSLQQRESAKTFYYLGLCYKEQKNFEQASFYYTRSIRLNPRLWKAYRERGHSFSQIGKYFQALQDYDVLIDSGNVDYLSYFYRGEVYVKTSKDKEALRDFNRCLGIKNNYPPAYAARSLLILRLKNDIKGALSDIEKAIELAPNESSYFNKRAMLKYRVGNEAEALSDISKAIKLDGKDKYFYNRGMIYRAQKKWQEAIDDFTTVISLNERNAQAYHSRGRTFFYENHLQKAMRDFDKAIAISPEAMFYFHRGLVHSELKMLKEALIDFDKAIEIRSEAEFYYEKAIILYDMKKFLEALRECNQSITANPDVADYYFLRAKIHELLGNEEDAAVNRAMGKRLNSKSNY